MSNYKIVNSKNTFIITLIVISLTIITVWLFGLGSHRTIYENSLLSTTFLSAAFFLFISIGLFRGLKLKDNLGKITDRFDKKKIDFIKDAALDDSSSIPDAGEGILGTLISLILWLIIAILISYLFWVFSAILWSTILTFIAMLYWIFFRALRLVFKRSAQCKGNHAKSLLYGFAFTLLYNFWIYAIIMMRQCF